MRQHRADTTRHPATAHCSRSKQNMPQESPDASKAEKKFRYCRLRRARRPQRPCGAGNLPGTPKIVVSSQAPCKLNQMVDLAERRLNNLFSALADPGRRWIVKRLAQPASTPLTPSDLTRHLHMSLQGVIKHLAILERAGIVRREKRGRKRLLFLDSAAMHAAGAWIEFCCAAGEKRSSAAHIGHTHADSQVHPHANPPLPPRGPHAGGR